jgi:hypothetical protein
MSEAVSRRPVTAETRLRSQVLKLLDLLRLNGWCETLDWFANQRTLNRHRRLAGAGWDKKCDLCGRVHDVYDVTLRMSAAMMHNDVSWRYVAVTRVVINLVARDVGTSLEVWGATNVVHHLKFEVLQMYITWTRRCLKCKSLERWGATNVVRHLTFEVPQMYVTWSLRLHKCGSHLTFEVPQIYITWTVSCSMSWCVLLLVEPCSRTL